MRKYLLILILIITALVCLLLMSFGLGVIPSFAEVEQVRFEKQQVLGELNYKNSTEFTAKKAALNSAAEEYKNKKNQYDSLVKDGKITDSDLYDSMELYDIDFLWTIIGNYATQKDVTLQFDVSKSATSAAISSQYVMCDLSFTVTGEYIALTDFVYSMENDEKLNFEISNFVLEKGGENLQATFVVKEVPINSSNLSTVPTTSAGSYSEILSEN